MPATLPQAVQSCHDLLLWLIPQLDKFPRARRLRWASASKCDRAGFFRSTVHPSTSSGRTDLLLNQSCLSVRAEPVEARSWRF